MTQPSPQHLAGRQGPGHPHPRPWRAWLASAALALCGPLATAADTPSTMPSDKPGDKLTSVRTHVAQKNWTAAVAELRTLNDVASADWHNLMGYSLRKGTPPDHPGAERHYSEALRINPQHRGALEYSGELFLLMGDLPRAEAQLAVLDKLCLLPCEEYTDLKKAIAAYKAKR